MSQFAPHIVAVELAWDKMGSRGPALRLEDTERREGRLSL
jgi:hypothetical protein